jgi:prepilin-type N-terminal cleavage/methylation domain-containing protein/prepilin-type processing-associated H-X9-DG protein
MKSRSSAFTLIELLVVIAIICILAALIFPAIRAVDNTRDETVALSNMRQVGAAFILYANDNSYNLPSRISSGNKWPALLSQYLSDVRVYASSSAQAIANNGNRTSFIMNGYNDLGTFANGEGTAPIPIRLNAFPNTSNIILLGTPKNPTLTNPTTAHNSQYYMDFEEAPNGNQNDVLDLAAFNGGSNYLFADGSAKFITQATYAAPDPNNPSQRYGDDLWCVDKSYVIPKVGKGGGP